MKEQRARPIYRIAEPIKNLAQRFLYLGLVAAAFALMLLGKADMVLMERFRAHVTDAVAPILEIVSRPADSIAVVIGQVRELTRIRAENERLKADQERLLHWQTVARHFEAENKALREILQFVPGPSVGFITARVIADAGGAFAHSLILNAGSHQGVRKGQAVITGNGLVGRIIGVGSRSARVLLITDLNSRIPVLVEHSRTRAILSGDNSDNPRLILLPPGETVSPGDRIVTSGHGGAFPPGLPVGIITNAGDGSNAVRIFIKREQLEYVRVIDTGPRAALPSQSEAEGPTDQAAGPGEGESAAVKPSAR